MLKAIETRYKGYRFRSRLEARWAVFFDALKVKWDYEVEGYDLDTAGWYLPDFTIKPGVRLNKDRNISPFWIEIKGDQPTLEELNKAKSLAVEAKGMVLIVSGTPGEEKVYLFTKEDTIGPDITDGYPVWCDVFHGHYQSCVLTHQAYEAARSARFEHGEQP